MIVLARRIVRSDRTRVSHGERAAGAQARSIAARVAAGLLALAAGALPVAAATYYVDTNNPNANDSGPGTEAIPYRTIDRAVTVRGGPNVTIEVKAGRYPEQVTVTKSGTLAEPFVIKAVTHPVTIDGGENFSFVGLWAPAGGTTFRTALLADPSQVLVDGVRLTITGAEPASMPAGTWRWIFNDGLYVNLGGPNPGSRSTFVSTRLYGLRITSANHVQVEGIQVTRVGTHGIYLPSNGTHVVLKNNSTSWNGVHGIAVVAGTNLLIEGNQVHHNANHGVSLIDASSSVVQENTIYDNGSANAFAVGLRLFNSSSNTIRRNRLYGNSDSGVELAGGSNSNQLALNLAYANADHGFQHLQSINNVHNSSVAWGNARDGISVEGNSTGTQIWNTILADNGIDSSRFDLLVDTTSTAGFTSNHNVIWNSTAQNPVRYNNVQYNTVAAYTAATGKDASTIQANPRFVNASTGDFRVTSGSPAIDSGNSSTTGWQTTDFVKQAPVDDAPTPNTGAGAVPYADRGALEFVRSGSVGVQDAIVDGVALSSPRPNPARGGEVALALELPREVRVSWEVLDLQGRVVWQEDAGTLAAGRSVLRWSGVDRSGSRVAPGLYLARIAAGRATLARRIVVIH